MDNRIELNVHSVFDEMDSVITIPELVKFAKSNNMTAIALTDFNSVQGFPEFEKECRKSGVKPIYGAQIIHDSFKGYYPYVSTILVRNQKGLKNLYRIISELKNDGICVNVPISVLKKYHEGLLYGSAGHEGSVFLAQYHEDFDELEDFLKFYDYFEIDNFNGTAKEKKINNIIVDLANELKKPVVAVSSAKCIGKNDTICLKILDSWYENNDNLHLRTDEEMLSEFSYLGDCSEDVVIKNTQKITEQIENITIIPDVNTDNIFKNSYAYEVIKVSAKNFAIDKYGESLPPIIAERLKAELQLPVVKKFANQIWLSRKIVKEIDIRGRLCNTRLAAASSFLIYCLDITEINPLPPHYYCPKCMRVEWRDNVYCGLDLPEKECSCGGTMHGDGMNIPYQSFFGFCGDKVPDIDLNADYETQDIVINKLNSDCFENNRLTCAGSVNYIKKPYALKLIADYEARNGLKLEEYKKEQIAKKLTNVKLNNGNITSSFFAIPIDKEIFDFTPVSEDKYHSLPIAHFNFRSLCDALYKIDIVPARYLELLHELETYSGVKVEEIPVNSKEIFTLLKRYDLKGVTDFDTKYLYDVLDVVTPLSFADLIKIEGLGHGTGTWYDNADLLIKSKVCKLSEIPASHDDVFNDLVAHGLNKEKAFRYSQIVRKGLFAKNRLSADALTEFETDLAKIGMPRWYIEYLKKIEYMCPKAYDCELVRIAIIESYYKSHFKETYNQFSNRLMRT